MKDMLETINRNKVKFVGIWFLVFLVSFVLLSIFGLVPNETEEDESPSLTKEMPAAESLVEKLQSIAPSLPQRVSIDKIGVDVSINNPRSRSIDVLDNSLLTGAVRYPTSGLLAENTNVLLFGHSSNLPIVRNTNYRAFNDLEDLREGDLVNVFSETHQFIYEVKVVEEADAENALVVFDSDRPRITLSTCNTFGNLNDRFVVKADLVDVRSL